jgi:hypothetical protein
MPPLRKGGHLWRSETMSLLSRLILSGLCLATMSSAFAAVVRVEVLERSDVGKTGYEQITGKLHFEIDPKLPGNAVIADVDLAPVNAAGKVSFVGRFEAMEAERRFAQQWRSVGGDSESRWQIEPASLDDGAGLHDAECRLGVRCLC